METFRRFCATVGATAFLFFLSEAPSSLEEGLYFFLTSLLLENRLIFVVKAEIDFFWRDKIKRYNEEPMA